MQSIQASSASFQCNFQSNIKCFLFWSRSSYCTLSCSYTSTGSLPRPWEPKRICSQSANGTAVSGYKGSCHGTDNPSSNKTFNPNPIKPWCSIISFHQPWVRGPASPENAFFSFWCPHTTHNKRISTKYWHLPLLQQSPISSVFI